MPKKGKLINFQMAIYFIIFFINLVERHARKDDDISKNVVQLDYHKFQKLSYSTHRKLEEFFICCFKMC